MGNNFTGAGAKLANYKDEELRKIIYADYSEYESEAIDLAKSELFGRHPKNIWESEGITLQDVALCSLDEDIEQVLKEDFWVEPEYINNYLIVANKLRKAAIEHTGEVIISMEPDVEAKLKVIGEDTKSGDKVSIRFCSWNEWAGFFIKNEQLQEFGKERYLICCLIEMTSAGFDEDEIKNNFNLILDGIEDNADVPDCKPEHLICTDNEVTFDKIADRGPEAIKNMLGTGEYSQIRPWVRFWARGIDMFLWIATLTFIAYFINVRFDINPDYWLADILTTMIYYGTWIPVEALLVSKWGYTPGKWLLNINLRDQDGELLSIGAALNRAVNVFVFGQGAAISLLTVFANVMSYSRLKEKGKTRWDAQGSFVVTHKSIGYKRIIVILVLISVISLLYSL